MTAGTTRKPGTTRTTRTTGATEATEATGANGTTLEQARQLVAKLAAPRPDLTFVELRELGLPARDAVVAGLQHGHWQVRRWCALWLDHFADTESLHALIPLLFDTKKEVRLFAVHSLACDRCKEGENPIDAVPLLMERVANDESIRVRRHAVAMLAFQHAHPDLEGYFQHLLDTETDAKLHKHAGFGLLLSRQQAAEAVGAAKPVEA